MQIFGLARIGRDAELRYTADSTPVASLSLAFSYGKKDPATNKKPTEWVNGSLWGDRAAALVPHLLKGQQIVVTIDDAHTETFTKQDGSIASKIVGRISALEFAGSPQQAAQAPQQQRQAPPPRQAAPARQAPAPTGGSGFDDMDDDIPFISCSMSWDMDTSKSRTMRKYDYQ